jgi:hypothetical protein
LAEVVRRALTNAVDWKTGEVKASSRLIPLESEPTTEDELRQSLQGLRATLKAKPDDGPARVDVLWHELMVRRHEEGTVSQAMAAEIQAIACGDVVFVGLSGETFTRLGWILREGAPDHHPLIAATSNGVLGYIATEEDVQARSYASFAACKIYGMPLPAPGAGETWAKEGMNVVREATGVTGSVSGGI